MPTRATPPVHAPCPSCREGELSGEARLARVLKEALETLKKMRSKYPIPGDLYKLLLKSEKKLSEKPDTHLTTHALIPLVKSAYLVIGYYRSHGITLNRLKREGLSYEEYAELLSLAGRISSDLVYMLWFTLSDYVRPLHFELVLAGSDVDSVSGLRHIAQRYNLDDKFFIVARPESTVEVYAGDWAWENGRPPVRARIILGNSKATTSAPTPMLPLEVMSVASEKREENRVTVEVDVAGGRVTAEGPNGRYTGGVLNAITEWPVPRLDDPSSMTASFGFEGEAKEAIVRLIEYYVLEDGLVPESFIDNDLIVIDRVPLTRKHPAFKGPGGGAYVSASEPVYVEFTRENNAQNLLYVFLKGARGPLKGGVVAVSPWSVISRVFKPGELVVHDEASSLLLTATAIIFPKGFEAGGRLVPGRNIVSGSSARRKDSPGIVGYLSAPAGGWYYREMKEPVLVTAIGWYGGRRLVAVLSGSANSPQDSGVYTRMLLYPVTGKGEWRVLGKGYIAYKGGEWLSYHAHPAISSAYAGAIPVFDWGIREHNDKSRELAGVIERIINKIADNIVLSFEWETEEFFARDVRVGDWNISLEKKWGGLGVWVYNYQRGLLEDKLLYSPRLDPEGKKLIVSLPKLLEGRPTPVVVFVEKNSPVNYVILSEKLSTALSKIARDL